MDKDKKDLFKTILLLSVPSILGFLLTIGLVYTIYRVGFSYSPKPRLVARDLDVDRNRALGVLGLFFDAVNKNDFSEASHYVKSGGDLPYRDYCAHDCDRAEFLELIDNAFLYTGLYGTNYDFLSKYEDSMVIISVEKQEDETYKVLGYRSANSRYYKAEVLGGRLQFIRKL